MAQSLVKATEQLIEAALSEGATKMAASSQDAVVELRHIHATADKLLAEVENMTLQLKRLEASQQTQLKQLEASQQTQLKQLEASQLKQARIQRLQGALSLVDTFNFTYETNNGYTNSKELSRGILQNALQGLRSFLPDTAKFEDPKATDAYGRSRNTREGFHDKMVSHLYGITGIKPTISPSTDGKSFLIDL